MTFIPTYPTIPHMVVCYFDFDRLTTYVLILYHEMIKRKVIYLSMRAAAERAQSVDSSTL